MRALLLLLLLAVPSLAVGDPFAVTATPQRVLLGRDAVVSLRVEVPPGSPPLRAAASVGRLIPQPPAPSGALQYLWTPPDIRYPLLAVLAFWVDTPEGPPQVTPVYIPLLGRTTLDVATNVGAGAQVVVQVAGASFGPVRTNRLGRAKVPVEVPPGVREASVLATKKRQQTVRTAKLDVPPERPLLALIGPEKLPSDGSGWLVVLGERPVPGEELELRLKGGHAQEEAPGLFRLTPEAGALEVRVDAQRRDGSASAHTRAPVALAPPVLVSQVRVAPAPPVEVQPALAVAPVTPPPPAPRVTPPAPQGGALSLHLLAGGFLAGGDNRGPLASLGAGWRLPGLGERLALEAELGLRQSVTRPRVEPLGTVDSRVLALPVLLSARVLAFEQGRLSVLGRAGAGVAYYDHRATSTFFNEPLTHQGRTFMGFLAAQAAWSFGAVSTLVEVRASHAPARATLVDAQLGGVSASLGLRYTP